MPTVSPSSRVAIEDILADQELRDAALQFFGGGGQLKSLAHVTDAQLESVYDLGLQFYRTDKYDKAEPLLQLCCLLDTTQPRFWRALAATRQMRGRLNEALDAFGMGLLLEPTNPTNLLDIANCLISQGEIDRAREALRSMPEIGGSNPKYHAVRARAAKLLAVLEHARPASARA